ncbi:hypothetical protein F4677DRAFT_441846 [Hypoxylon crocopeplum]|nr:hypothetical protein F4677DRAFT_441846 [Hypoxylon crocopeplum]
MRMCGSPNTNPPTNVLSPDEAEQSLTVFRSQMQHHLAFVHIPPDLTAEQLRKTRPFLFRAIVAVTSPSTHQKMARGKELKRVLAHNAIVENQSSLDLLLSLLTYVAWGWDPFLNKDGTLSRLIMLAISLVSDLRLNKPLPTDVHMIGPLTPGFGKACKDAVQDTYVSSYYAQIDAMRWTPQMEEGIRAINSHKEYPSDEVFAFQVRLQLLAQRALHAREKHETDYPHLATAPVPAFLYLNALQGQLQGLKDSLSPELEYHEILITHLYYIDLCINEAAHTANSNTPLVNTPETSNDGCTSGFERLECLWGSVRAIKSWFDVFFTLSPSTYRGLSFLLWAQLARCLVILYRLSTLEDPAWDRKAVRNMVDLLQVLDRIAEKLEITSHETGEQSNDDLFMQVPRIMRMFRAWAVSKMAHDETGEEPGCDLYSDAAIGIGDNIIGQTQNQMVGSIDFNNDRWWEEFSIGLR